MNTHLKTIIFIAAAMFGTVIGEKSMHASEIAVAALILSVAQVLVMIIGKWRKMKCVAPLFMLLCSIGLCLGIMRSQLVEEQAKYVCESTCVFEAVVVNSPHTKNDYQILKVHPTEGDDTMLDVQLRVPLYPKYEIGQTLSISGKVTEPSVIAAHGDVKSFDYASYLLTRNVGSEMMFPHIEVIDSEAHDATSMLGRWKEDLVRRISLYVSSPASSLASGMLFGDTSASKELTQTFRTVGLSHIVVLSGFNIAIVIAFILFVFAFLPLTLRVALASISVILFVMMVGGEANVIRATLMAFVSLLATLVGRAYVAKQALILSLFAIVMYEPYALLHDVSLHLSFLATAGIVYLSKPFEEIFMHYIPDISKSFRELFITTLSAYLATLPYICFSFGTVSVYALLANIFVLPFVPITMLLSFLVVSGSYAWTPLALMFGFVDSVLINIVLWVAHLFERLPFATFPLSVSWFGMCMMYAGIGIIVLYVYTRSKNETQVTRVGGILTDVISY
jgi:competence protein ComEC